MALDSSEPVTAGGEATVRIQVTDTGIGVSPEIQVLHRTSARAVCLSRVWLTRVYVSGE